MSIRILFKYYVDMPFTDRLKNIYLGNVAFVYVNRYVYIYIYIYLSIIYIYVQMLIYIIYI